MNKMRLGILNLAKFQHLMKNVELIHVDFTYAHYQKFMKYLD